ncbi:serine O-acetyltransferase [Paenibacillus donghaensis]|uniref:serine O-acetyltransferase n=1 Tax=Paenibacillus donghaensis TaxID=414771 RepID=UPI0012FE4126|nr:serine acetyltransferase [Paenibacillus donghaensis]
MQQFNLPKTTYHEVNYRLVVIHYTFWKAVVFVNVDMGHPFVRSVINTVQRYNHKQYWRMRNEVVSSTSNRSKITRLIYLLRIKRMDAFNNASMGTDLGSGAQFSGPPTLYHGLNGIVVSHFAKIGKNCTIYQRVTIAEGADRKAATIGDNCIVGAGAVIIGGVTIGNSVKIGANCVVTKDVPGNSTVVGNPGVVIGNDVTE